MEGAREETLLFLSIRQKRISRPPPQKKGQGAFPHHCAVAAAGEEQPGVVLAQVAGEDLLLALASRVLGQARP